jgi:hypothetical protein
MKHFKGIHNDNIEEENENTVNLLDVIRESEAGLLTIFKW